MSQMFGGSTAKTQSQSNNQAYPMLSQALGGQVNNSGAASNQMANMLGLNGTQGQNQGFQNWQNSTGYQFGLNQGQQSVTGNAAAQGLLNSGATAKALDTYGQNYANTQYGNYDNQLQGLIGSGNQAANTIGGAGQQSSSTGQTNTTNGSGFFGSQGSASAGLGALFGKP